MALVRADRDGRSLDVEADEFDVLVGIMLAHPGESEARQLLAHIGASAADVLPPDYPVPGKDLERYSGEIPADRPPQLTAAAEQAIANAVSEYRGDAVLELRGLFGGLLLGSSSPLATNFRELLGRVGLTGAVDSYRDYLAKPPKGGYAEFLAQHHPFSAKPVEIPDYKADKQVIGDDLVDIRAEVDAFAYLLASRSLKPPLAVGLFGEWGSGKSFFMDSVRNRIAQLVGSSEVSETAQNALPFWKKIVQIDFNAWHYVDGDLWASLVERVFSELRVTAEEGESELAKRQKHWLDQIEIKRKERTGVSGQLDRKKRERSAARVELTGAQATRRKEEKKLEEAQQNARADLALRQSKKAADDALAEFADNATSGTATQTLRAISDARTQLQRGTTVLAAYPWKRRHALLGLAALVAVPLLVFGLARIEAIPATAQVFAGASAALGLATAALRSVTSWAKGQLNQLEDAEREVKADIESQRKKLDASVQAAAESLADANAEVEQLAAKDRAIEQEIAVLQARAKSVTSGQILSEFVAERVGSTDYRKLLGTAALIQRDFQELSKLIAEQNDESVKTNGSKQKPPSAAFNRIILYIDDLDRCEPEQVIRVLQAVHLLLAFPLFVVVVAVDSRWLAHSLADRYPALATSVKAVSEPSPASRGADPEEAGAVDVDHATPSDYLEKIFQVPFWIEPLGEPARKSLVRGLLQGNLLADTSRGGANGGGIALEFGDDSEAMVRAMFGRTRAMHLQTAAMSVTPTELAYLDDLAPLLGATPRSIKRFVNVYQLLCALPVPPGLDAPLYEQMSGFLLAIADGAPAFSAALHQEMEKNMPGATLASAIANARLTLDPLVALDEMARYDEWAGDHPALVATSAVSFAEPARRVRRFSFRG